MGSLAMSRFSTMLNVALIAVVLAQAWMLHGRGAPAAVVKGASDPSRADAASMDTAAAVGPAANETPLAMAVMDRLQRIDARLAALEQATRPPSAAAAETSGAPTDPRTMAEADRRLAVVLPVRELDREGWVRWQASLASMPPDERLALSTAFSRAVNDDKIRLKF